MTLNPLIRRFSHAVEFTEEDRAELQRITSRPRSVAPRTNLIHEGDRPEVVRVVMSGVACRYQSLPDGGRQIVALLLPGDLCDMHVAILGAMDHSLATLSACEVVEIPRSTIKRLIETNPRITHALWWSTLVDEAILRHWLANKGRRLADHQLLHLFQELLVRLEAVGLTEDNAYTLSITQAELSDILGISVVHTHRTIQWMRTQGLADFQGGRVNILDRERMRILSDFNPEYLHLSRRV